MMAAGRVREEGDGRRGGPLAALLVAAIGLAAGGCGAPRQSGEVEFALIQLSEISDFRPTAPGRTPRLARVAGLRARSKVPAFVTLSGDLFSPSPTNDFEYLGEPLEGRPVVAVMNALGLDFATFGNHEFDLKEDQFYRRLGDSRARWVSTNVADRERRAFPRVPRSYVFTVDDTEHPPVRVALIALTTDANREAPYVRYLDPVAAARREVDLLAGRYDLLIALTHLDPDVDRRLARIVPEINLILAGQGRSTSFEREPKRSLRGIPIARSEPNARAVWVHRLAFDTGSRRVKIDSTLEDLDRTGTPDDDRGPDVENVEGVIRMWTAKSDQVFEKKIRQSPATVVGRIPEGRVLEGRTSLVRNGPTNLTRLVGEAMLAALDIQIPRGDVDQPRLAVFNAGMLRLDDQLREGDITLYDVYRIFPFRDAKIRAVLVDGETLRKLLKQSREREKGRGSFLHAYGRDGQFSDDDVDDDVSYLVAMNEYLADGRENAYRALGLEDLERKREDLGQEFNLHKALVRRLKDAHESFPDDDADESAEEATGTKTQHVEFIVSPSGSPTLDRAKPPEDPRALDIYSAMKQEVDERTKLDLARTLIRLDPSCDEAAEVLVEGFRSRRGDVNAKARRLIPELLPAAPPALIHKLTPLLRDRDRFVRADVAEMLSLVDWKKEP